MSRTPLQLPRLDLEREDISAKEAHRLIAPHVATWREQLLLIQLASAGAVNSVGRLRAGVGAWYFWYWSPAKEVGVRYSLFFDGGLSFEYPASCIGLPREAIVEPWLDSIDVASIVAAEPMPQGANELELCHLVLTLVSGTPYWEAWRTFYKVETQAEQKEKLLVDAQNGRIVFDSFDVSVAGVSVYSQTRNRLSDGVPGGG